MRASENPVATIPENILVTSARPDIVLVGVDEVTLIELTIPHNSMESLNNARDRKSHKEPYLQALSDLEAKGLVTLLYTVEIGSLGHWLPNSQRALMLAAPLLTKQTARKTMDEAAHKIIGASQVILMHDQRKPGPHHVFSSELLRNLIFFIVYFFLFFASCLNYFPALAKNMLPCSHATLSSGVIFIVSLSIYVHALLFCNK